MDVAKPAIKLSFRSPRTLLLKQLESVTVAASFSPSGLGAFVVIERIRSTLPYARSCGQRAASRGPGLLPVFTPRHHFLFLLPISSSVDA